MRGRSVAARTSVQKPHAASTGAGRRGGGGSGGGEAVVLNSVLKLWKDRLDETSALLCVEQERNKMLTLDAEQVLERTCASRADGVEKAAAIQSLESDAKALREQVEKMNEALCVSAEALCRTQEEYATEQQRREALEGQLTMQRALLRACEHKRQAAEERVSVATQECDFFRDRYYEILESMDAQEQKLVKSHTDLDETREVVRHKEQYVAVLVNKCTKLQRQVQQQRDALIKAGAENRRRQRGSPRTTPLSRYQNPSSLSSSTPPTRDDIQQANSSSGSRRKYTRSDLPIPVVLSKRFGGEQTPTTDAAHHCDNSAGDESATDIAGGPFAQALVARLRAELARKDETIAQLQREAHGGGLSSRMKSQQHRRREAWS